MRKFIFRCPVTTASLQGSNSSAREAMPYYIAQPCVACGGLHLVNPDTGGLLSEERAKPVAQPASQ